MTATRCTCLWAANRIYVVELNEAEEAVAQSWGRLLPNLKDTP